MEKIDIIGAVFGDTSFIAYRPDLRKITPSISAAILLQQIVHRWRKNGNEKFYKFREPCEHEKYRPGDSWTEELGFSGKEFDSALRSIGFKLGKTKNEIEKKDAFIVYYRDNEGLTWYSLNEELLSTSLLGNYQGVDQRGSTKVLDQRGTTNTNTEITTEITTKKKKNTSFFRNPKESARYEELRKHTGSSYEPDGNSPLVIREEIKKLEKQMKLRETPEKVKFMFTAGWQFFNWYKSVVGLEYHGGILSLDPVAKLLSEWYDRGMNEMGVTRLVSRYFKSRKAKEGVITPTSCFSEHTFQAFVQNKLK